MSMPIVMAIIAATAAIVIVRVIQTRLGRVTIYEFQRGLKYRKGRFLEVVEPGQYWIFMPTTAITPVDVRPNFVTLVGQELLTADGVPVKVSFAANYEMEDPALAVNGNANYAQALHLALQLAVREVIASANVDDLTKSRVSFGEKVRSLAEPGVERLGLRLLDANLKDVMISGELKKSFAQVVKARKDGEAALERARGETAALRNLANAARVLRDNPLLMQLRVLQAIGESTGNTVLEMPTSTIAGQGGGGQIDIGVD